MKSALSEQPKTKSSPSMKAIQTALKVLAAATLTLLMAGCASEFQSKKDLAVASGFKVITPVKDDQVALLATLPAGKITPITYGGKKYYILPDAANHQAYVGGESEYQAYERLRLAKRIAEDNLAAAQMNQMVAMNAMNWGAWGGWGGIGYPYGGYRRVGMYYR
jgi:hypothetical protein